MQLDEFVASTIYSVMKALKETDVNLIKDELGSICSGNITTLGKDLVNVRLIKVDDPTSTKSVPAILFDYEVNIIVDETKRKKVSGEISASAKLLHVFSATATMTEDNRKEYEKAEVQKLRFTVPVVIRNNKKPSQ